MKSIYIRNTFGILLILLCAALMAGCSGGGSGYNDMSDKGGKLLVCLAVEGMESVSENSISADGSLRMSDIAFYYKATPTWTKKSVQGSTGGKFVKLASSAYSDGKLPLGYFKEGTWLFELEARKASTGTVLFTGSSTGTISRGSASSTVTVEVDVTVDMEIPEDSTTTVDFQIGTPSGGSVVITYTGPVSGTVPESAITALDGYTVDSDGNIAAADGWTVYSVTLTDMPSGVYTFTVEYQLNGDTVNTITVEVPGIPGEEATIAGTIASDEAAVGGANIVVTVPYITLHLTRDGYTFTADVQASASPVTYIWSVNGAVQAGEAGSTYTLSGLDAGTYDVTCAAEAGGHSTSATLQVTVAP